MDVFKQLTRGIHFNTNKYTEEAHKFGLKKGKSDAPPKTVEPEFEFPADACDESNADENDSGECSDEEGEEEETELTLLGNITTKVRRKVEKRKKSKSKARLAQLRQESINHFRNLHRIHVTGTDVPEPLSKWASLKERFGVPEPLIDVISSHFPNPTPVQMQAIPCLLERRELLGNYLSK
jgi:ATP-dependent RNA helicase DDX52/ROK1